MITQENYKQSFYRENMQALLEPHIEHMLTPMSLFKKPHYKDNVKMIFKTDIDDALEYATSLARARAPIIIHESFSELPQRFINCLNPNSYVRPHMHVVPDQWELMCWVSGKIIALLFDSDGMVISKILMDEANVRIIEIPPFCYHTFVAVEKSAFLEVRNCKYQPSVDRIYSAWSPEENSAGVEDYLKRLLNSEKGSILRV